MSLQGVACHFAGTAGAWRCVDPQCSSGQHAVTKQHMHAQGRPTACAPKPHARAGKENYQNFNPVAAIIKKLCNLLQPKNATPWGGGHEPPNLISQHQGFSHNLHATRNDLVTSAPLPLYSACNTRQAPKAVKTGQVDSTLCTAYWQ